MIIYSHLNFEIARSMTKAARFFLDGDGSSAVIDRDLLIVVSPLAEPNDNLPGISLLPDVAVKILNMIPRGAKVPVTERVVARNDDKDNDSITFQALGADHTHRIVCQSSLDFDPVWKMALRRIRQRTIRGVKFCVSKDDMERSTDLIKRLAGPKDTAIYYELSDKVLLARALSPITGQHISIGIPLIDTENNWLRDTDWEKSVLAMTARVKRS